MIHITCQVDVDAPCCMHIHRIHRGCGVMISQCYTTDTDVQIRTAPSVVSILAGSDAFRKKHSAISEASSEYKRVFVSLNIIL